MEKLHNLTVKRIYISYHTHITNHIYMATVFVMATLIRKQEEGRKTGWHFFSLDLIFNKRFFLSVFPSVNHVGQAKFYLGLVWEKRRGKR